MTTATMMDVKARLGEYLDQCATEGPVVITRDGKPAAVLVAPADKEDLDRLLLARSPRFQALLNKSRRSIRAGKGLSRDQFWAAAKRRSKKSE